MEITTTITKLGMHPRKRIFSSKCLFSEPCTTLSGYMLQEATGEGKGVIYLYYFVAKEK